MDQLTKEEQLQNLAEIRSLMERSSRFISLSGLSGVGAGVCALVGSAAAHWRMQQQLGPDYHSGLLHERLAWELVGIATLTLVAALSVAAFFTVRKARKQQEQVWDRSMQQLVANLLIPLGAGGLFCLIMIKHGTMGFVAPATLIFYGLALINGSRYTLNDFSYLGCCQIGLGLLNAWFMGVGNGIIFWTLGFGVLHIVYGIYLHYKYQ